MTYKKFTGYSPGVAVIATTRVSCGFSVFFRKNAEAEVNVKVKEEAECLDAEAWHVLLETDTMPEEEKHEEEDMTDIDGQG